MIAALGLALQIVAATPAGRTTPASSPTSFVIRDGFRGLSNKIPLVASSAGPMLRLSALSEMLPLTVRHGSGSKYTVELWGAILELEAGVPVVRIGDDARPLVTSPRVEKGQLLVPLQLISEVFPTSVANTRWDSDSVQLVVFTSNAPAAPARSSVERASTGDGASRASDNPGSRASDGRLPPVAPKRYRRTVIVDAGHGGVDNGMSGPLGGGPRIYEKDVTLAVATKLGRQLESRAVNVVYTRTGDTLIALDDRGRIANRANGNLFISIHVNAANPTWKDPRGARGFETYFLSEARTEDARRVEQMENESVHLEGDADNTAANDPLSFIKTAMTQNEHLRESSELAELIQRRLARMHPGPSRGVKQAGFRVLVTAYMPAVLVEIGFGSNPAEAAYISSPAKQDALAAAIADAAMEYLDGYESRIKAGAGTGSQR